MNMDLYTVRARILDLPNVEDVRITVVSRDSKTSQDAHDRFSADERAHMSFAYRMQHTGKEGEYAG